MIQRHQDYILTIPLIPAGKNVQGIPLTLDTDAPFSLRSRALRVVPVAPTLNQNQVLSTRMRYTNSKGGYLAQAPIQAPQDFNFAFGNGAQWRRVWQEVAYPPGGNINVDFYNDSNQDMTNLQVMFRGVKLFREGSIDAPSYPANCTARDFTYQSGQGTNPNQAGLLNPLVLPTVAQLRNIPFQIAGDADFVLRAGQLGLWTSSGFGGVYSTNGYVELYVQLFDANLKPYSNVPIHVDWLFGNAGGCNNPGFVALGNSAPGLFVPEIYIPRNQALYFDLFRNDTAYVGATDALPVRISMAWVGSKIYS
jgi:hypothetical protein